MLHLGSIYLIVKNIDESIQFYENLLEMKVSAKNYDRWAQFNFENKCIALFSEEYDKRAIKYNENMEQHYNAEYLNYFKERKISYGNNFVLNFWIEDLNKEFKRLEALNIGKMSEIMYVNIASPYYFFTVLDPDGNTIEITGKYTKNI